MSKAEERALEAYPDSERDKTGFVTFLGFPQAVRNYYVEGYEQAEKDLSLTWEDVENIVHIYEIAKDVVGDYDIELYEEVLARFKQIKGDKK